MSFCGEVESSGCKQRVAGLFHGHAAECNTPRNQLSLEINQKGKKRKSMRSTQENDEV